MAKNEVVLRINMSVTNFYCKILRELTTEELNRFLLLAMVAVKKHIPIKSLLERFWCTCVNYGYNWDDYDVMELDTMKFVV